DQKTGTLTLQQDERRIHLWFEEGAVRVLGLGENRGPSVVNGLLALQKIPPEHVEDLERPKRGEGALVKRLAKKYSLSGEDLQQALGHEITEHLFEAFLWGQANYEFVDGDPDSKAFNFPQLNIGLKMGVDGLVMEVLRRRDEWQEVLKAVVPSSEILVKRTTEPPGDADPTMLRIFSLVDGSRSVQDILNLTRLGAFSVHKALSALIRRSAVRTLTAAEAVERARDHGGRGNWEPALRFVEFGLEREPNNTDLRDIAADCFVALARNNDAVAQYRLLGAAQAESGQHEAALATYRKLVALAPSDLQALERILDLLMTLERKEDLLSAGEDLARIAKKKGLPEKARDVYARLLESFRGDTRLLESLADLERHLGDRREAVQLYRKLLKPALDGGNHTQAAEYCRTVLRLDPGQRDLLPMLDKLERGILQEAHAKKKKRKVTIIVAVVSLVVAVLIGYELSARLVLADKREAMFRATTEGRHREALELYNEFLDAWTWSIAAGEIRGDRDRVEDLYAREVLERSRALEERGDLLAALTALREARRIVRRDELFPHFDHRITELSSQRSTEEEERTKKIGLLALRVREANDEEAAKALAAIRDPFAVPGLRECLRDRSSEVRRAAVTALGGIEGPAPLRALVEALADPEEFIRSLAARMLAGRTGEDFGTDRVAWDRWVRTHTPAAGKAPVLQTVLQPLKVRVRAGGPALVEWRLVNLGSAPVKFSLSESPADLTVTGPDGKDAHFPLPRGYEGDVRLPPGGFFGGTFDLAKLGPPLASAGAYRIGWTATAEIDGEKHVIEAAPVVVEVVE
ncbi:MAG: DUF4388 domain-containing protein, partial [Planctomycetota bacterium]